MKRISLDNGNTFTTASKAMREIADHNLWDAVVEMMDVDVMETVANFYAPCSRQTFLHKYLLRAKDNLIIG